MGWAGPIYSGEDANGRVVRLIPLKHLSLLMREDIRDRHHLLTTRLVERALPSFGIHVIDGIPYWIGGWRNGVPLTVILGEKKLPPSLVMAIGQQIATSLFKASQLGVVHSDLQPSAIWLASNGEVWIDGFGRKESKDIPLRTSSIPYVSPEGTASSAGDIYSLGTILLQMFLRTVPPVAEIDEKQHANQMKLLKGQLLSKGLPMVLVERVLSLVVFEPSKRPSIKTLRKKWDLSSPESMLRPWLIKHYPQIIQSGSPEDKVAQPISEHSEHQSTPKEFDDIENLDELFREPIEKQIVQSKGFNLAEPPKENVTEDTFKLVKDELVANDILDENSDDGLISLGEDDWDSKLIDFGAISDDPDSTLQGIELVNDDRTMEFESDEDDLLGLPEETIESMIDDPFDVQELEQKDQRMLTDEEFLNSETTQKIYSDDTEEYNDWGVEPLEDSSKVLQRAIYVFAILFIGLSYIFLFRDEPFFPDEPVVKAEVEQVAEELKLPTGFVQPKGLAELKEQPDAALSNSTEVEKSVVLPQQVPAKKVSKPKAVPKKTPPKQKTPKKTKSKPDKPKKASPVSNPPTPETKNPDEKTDDGWVTLSEADSVEGREDDPYVWGVTRKVGQASKEKQPMGKVIVKGEVSQVILTRNGRPYPPGSLVPGKYRVEVIFEGLSALPVGTLVVESEKTYVIKCDPAFAMCNFGK